MEMRNLTNCKTSTNSNVPAEIFEVSKRNRSIYGRIYNFAKNIFYVIAIIGIILYLIMNHKMQVQIRELQQGILKPSAHYVYGISNFNLHISLAHALKRRETLVCNAWKRNKKKYCHTKNISWNHSALWFIDFTEFLRNNSDMTVKLCNFHIVAQYSVEKWEILSHWNFFRQINYSVISLVKPLLSRNFCEKSVRENFYNFHNVSG